MRIYRDLAPIDETLTDYDRRCFKLYIMLIDADEAGVPWDYSYPHLFDEPVGTDYLKAEARYRSHLERAKWMTAKGYRHLL